MVIACMDTPYDGKYFHIETGVRRWIESREDANFYNIDISQVEWFRLMK